MADLIRTNDEQMMLQVYSYVAVHVIQSPGTKVIFQLKSRSSYILTGAIRIIFFTEKNHVCLDEQYFADPNAIIVNKKDEL